ncbi:G5 domain-containing protein [Varibaculum massiliense]|uniref:G5 domain-containing protein n=1 Tax=Varibaculum massiliense TaxID=1852372 RepID=UPI00288B016F|nr:G5 domain-containing protein [Varibaculum massiliense]
MNSIIAKVMPRKLGGILVTLLALALTAVGIVAAGPNAAAADGDSGTFIGLRWKTYADTAGQACNPKQAGQSAGRIAFYLTFEGKNKKTGAIEEFDSPYYMPEIKYCEDLQIPLKKEMQNIEETATYTDISKPKQVHWYVDGKHFPARATGSANLFHEGDTYWIPLVQQANQDVNNTKLTGMIAPWHEGKLKVAASYDIQETGKERKPYTSGNGNYPYFEGVFDFKDGESFSMISLPARDGQNALKKLTPATGRFKNWNEYTGKHKEFFLKAQFLDPEVAAAPYYKLNVTGNDIKGWEIELKSKLQKKEYQAKKTVPFKVERRANPKLAKGQERIVQQGVMGSEVTPMLKYFYLDDNNAEQIVKELANGDTVKTAAKNQIVEYGTAEKAAVKPDNKDHAAPRLKDTGVSSWGVLAASLATLVGGSTLLLARRHTVK